MFIRCGLRCIFANVVQSIEKKQADMDRVIVSIAGPPAAGKTTFAEDLVGALNARKTDLATLVPMDGFHLDNSALSELNLLHRKGAPQTFDVEGFHALLMRIRDAKQDQFAPTFDRARDISIAGVLRVSVKTPIIVVEGNYLLLETGPWSCVKNLFDHSVFIDAPLETLEERLVQRWWDNGYDNEGACKRAQSNDIPNANLVVLHSVKADQYFCQSSDPTVIC